MRERIMSVPAVHAGPFGSVITGPMAETSRAL
jgi:hypothetical protein